MYVFMNRHLNQEFYTSNCLGPPQESKCGRIGKHNNSVVIIWTIHINLGLQGHLMAILDIISSSHPFHMVHVHAKFLWVTCEHHIENGHNKSLIKTFTLYVLHEANNSPTNLFLATLILRNLLIELSTFTCKESH